MIILRQKTYGFLARLGGNKELKDKMFKAGYRKWQNRFSTT